MSKPVEQPKLCGCSFRIYQGSVSGMWIAEGRGCAGVERVALVAPTRDGLDQKVAKECGRGGL